MSLESLPVELIADILAELDLESLIKCSYLSKRLYLVASDPSLNPWRRPILRDLSTHNYEPALKHLTVRMTVPRHNWIDVMSLARPDFLLFEATLPNLRDSEWEECFKRRFLPSWRKWKRDGSWKEVFMKILYRVWHRTTTFCTSDESWTRYIVLNRNGSANEMQMSSRSFNPFTLFDEMKLQNNLTHLETRRRVVLELADVRIIAFGTLTSPKVTMSLNPNAHVLLHPPGIERGEQPRRHGASPKPSKNFIQDYGIYPWMSVSSVPTYLSQEYQMSMNTYTKLQHPTPAASYANYPFYTPGGGDRRWMGMPEAEEEMQWVGGLMLVAQLVTHGVAEIDTASLGRHQYASFSWSDLWAIAPWMEERITKRIDGPGLGN